MNKKPKRVTVLFNTDYDEELKAASPVDVSAVQEAAKAVRDAVADNKYETELIGIKGPDLPEIMGGLKKNKPDLVFNLCESLSGNTSNEPLIPAMLDLLEIPYTGANALGLGLCLHKDRAKDVLLSRGVQTPPHWVAYSERDLDDLPDLKYPYFVKLVKEDASIGISGENVVTNKEALCKRAKELLQQYKQPVICEQYVSGREFNVTVIGNGNQLECLPLHEIDFAAMPKGSPHIVSYAAKWDENHTDYAGTLPVPVLDASPDFVREVESTSQSAFKAMGLQDFARVDLRIDDNNKAWVIDVNPNCDLSPDAGVARAAQVGGASYADLIGRICQTAWTRHLEDSKTK